MQNKILLILSLVTLASICGCNPNGSTSSYHLTATERKICSTLQIDSGIVMDIRAETNSKIEPFHYSLSKMYEKGKETELDPVYLKGLVFDEQSSRSYNLVFNLKDGFKKKGYTIFLLESNFNIGNKPDRVGVLKTTDKYSVLQQIGTDGINYSITNDSLITIIKRFDKQCSLELIGASGDWCEFSIHKEPSNWLTFAKEVYKVCPDVVDQGTETVEALAGEMKKTKRLYFWWD